LPFSISCLNCARNGTRSDFKNRMLRPITRRWGICFRSTQRYTVCGLTPRKTAGNGEGFAHLDDDQTEFYKCLASIGAFTPVLVKISPIRLQDHQPWSARLPSCGVAKC